MARTSQPREKRHAHTNRACANHQHRSARDVARHFHRVMRHGQWFDHRPVGKRHPGRQRLQHHPACFHILGISPRRLQIGPGKQAGTAQAGQTICARLAFLAGLDRQRGNTVAHFPVARHRTAHIDNRAGEFVAEHGPFGHEAKFGDMQIGPANAAMGDFDHHLVRCRARIINRGNHQRLTDFFKYSCSHGLVLVCLSWRRVRRSCRGCRPPHNRPPWFS